MVPQVTYETQRIDVIPDQPPWIKETVANGVSGNYDFGAPVIPRAHGLPFQAENAERCQNVSRNMRKDAYA